MTGRIGNIEGLEQDRRRSVGIDIFLAIADLVVACAVTWLIIWYFLMPSAHVSGQGAGAGFAANFPWRDPENWGQWGADLDSRSHRLIRPTIVSALLTAPVLALDLFDRFGPDMIPSWLASPWVQAILITPVIFYCGREILMDGWKAMTEHRCTPDLLAMLATSLAYLYSLATCLAGSLLPEGSRSPYFDLIGVVITLLLLARVMSTRIEASLVASLNHLMQIQPASGLVADPKHPQTVPDQVLERDRIRPGDLLLVRTGERPAADGVVESGSALVDESELTGGDRPRACGPGDRILASSKILEGRLSIRVDAAGDNTYAAKLVKIIPRALVERSPGMRRMDRIVHTAIALIMILAVWTFMLWLMLGPQPHLAHAVGNAVCVLTIACPAVASMTIPMAFRTSLETGLAHGLLFTSPRAMNHLGQVRTLILDDSSLLDPSNPEDQGVHAESLTRAATHLRSLRVGSLILDGSPQPDDRIERAARQAGVDMLITRLTPERKRECLDRLNHDLTRTSRGVPADPAGQDAASSGRQSQTRLVALATAAAADHELTAKARVSIALGPQVQTGADGTDLLQPDLILHQGDLDGTGRAIELSRATAQVIRQNLVWSTVYNLVTLVLATGICQPLLGWMLNPMIAAVAGAMSTILAMLNVRRLHRLRHLRRRWLHLALVDTDQLPTVAARRPQVIVDSQWESMQEGRDPATAMD